MTSTKIIAAATFISVLSVNHAGALQAPEFSPMQTMKPLHAMSFDAGTQRAVSYFTSIDGHCKLVVTLAGAPAWDDVNSFSSTRFEAQIPASKATRFQATEGKSLEFTCLAGATAMSVKTVEQVATGTAR